MKNCIYCNEIFEEGKNQIYCTVSCRNKTNLKNFYSVEKNKIKHRQYNVVYRQIEEHKENQRLWRIKNKSRLIEWYKQYYLAKK